MTTAPAPRPSTTRRLTDAVSTSRAFAILLTLTGAIALAASAVLTLDKFKVLENPAYVPDCNINPVIACGSVMRSTQAAAFGFPNPLIGLGAFAVVVTVGVTVLTGARLPRWFWLGLQAGTLFGVGFITWLMDQTLYHIGAVCPYCIVVWICTIALFWYTTLHNLRRQVIPLPAGWRPGVDQVTRYHWVVPVAWYFVIALLILNRFWYYWRTLL
ncbi:vitamin K epoxide reductase family protein [Kitasatospora sp. RB6PN24]|uniref:vitamin K epoxide reductase family protein n=1 Tax=Kitasatospora humi TaxID=2893891 RepID=UPI001E33B711|nr:vitamin K epoxide reductase family protein [Kitasatospora humi]MCC9310981.1 vitamin K epoxide reductase family protein [Kitasatospora humi]